MVEYRLLQLTFAAGRSQLNRKCRHFLICCVFVVQHVGRGIWPSVVILVIFIHTILCRDRQTDRPDEKQYSQYSSQKAKSRKTSQTDAIKYPRDCPHTEYTEYSLLNSEKPKIS